VVSVSVSGKKANKAQLRQVLKSEQITTACVPLKADEQLMTIYASDDENDDWASSISGEK